MVFFGSGNLYICQICQVNLVQSRSLFALSSKTVGFVIINTPSRGLHFLFSLVQSPHSALFLFFKLSRLAHRVNNGHLRDSVLSQFVSASVRPAYFIRNTRFRPPGYLCKTSLCISTMPGIQVAQVRLVPR